MEGWDSAWESGIPSLLTNGGPTPPLTQAATHSGGCLTEDFFQQ